MFNGRHRLPCVTALLLTTIIFLATAGVAEAQLAATVTPARPGKGAHLQWSVDGATAPISGQIPTSLVVSAPPGFTLNTAAAAKRCSRLHAQLNECSSSSKIGSATMVIHVTKPSGPRDLPIPIKLYLGPKNSLLAVAFLAGVRVIPGSISGSKGITITFNPLPTPPVIPTVSYAFVSVTVNLGASRIVSHKVRRTVTRLVHGRKVRKKVVVRRERKRIDLVRTPSACGLNSWALSATIGLPGGVSAPFNAPVAC
ncbi:MAG: hypothetical protein ACXVVQ_07195 [Solirubrobacteraceae bacterium]